MPQPAQRVFEVVLLGVPVELLLQSRQQHDDLVREFTVMGLAHGELDPSQPEDLRKLIHRLGGSFARAVDHTNEQAVAAQRAGARHVDLRYQVPDAALPGISRLELLMARADEFCAQGLMLTMPRSAQMQMLARWWNGEFHRQLAGAAPIIWSEYLFLNG